MCVLMDLPAADRERFLKWNLDTLGGADFTSEAALAAYGEMALYWEGIVAERRGGDGTDLISQIVNTQLPGEDLSDAEIAGFCSLLHDAAQNTTMNMITHGVLTLAHEPDARRRLGAEPGLWPNAVEELLRYVSPVQGLARTTTRPVELHGVTIPEGDQVLVLYGSANHDERVHPDPERFDLDRESTKAHWAFGHGLHYCLGNAVARLEIQTSLRILVERIGDWDVDDGRVELDQLVPTRGVASTAGVVRACVGLNGQMTSSPPASHVSKYSRCALSTSSTRSPHSLAWKTNAYGSTSPSIPAASSGSPRSASAAEAVGRSSTHSPTWRR